MRSWQTIREPVLRHQLLFLLSEINERTVYLVLFVWAALPWFLGRLAVCMCVCFCANPFAFVSRRPHPRRLLAVSIPSMRAILLIADVLTLTIQKWARLIVILQGHVKKLNVIFQRSAHNSRE